MKQPLTICITGGGAPGYPAIFKALKGSDKYDVTVVAGDLNPYSGNLHKKEWVDVPYVLPPNSTPEFIEALLRIVREEKVDFLLSGVDEELPVLAAEQKRFAALGCRMLLPPPEPLEAAFDKAKTFHALDGRIPMPRTVLVDDETDIEAVFAELGGNVVIKACRTRGNRHNYHVDDLEELLFCAKRIRMAGLQAMIQEFIAGDEFNVSLMLDREGAPLYAVCRQKMDPPKLRPNTKAGLIRRIPEIEAYAVEASKLLGLVPGASNVEFIRTGSDGPFHLIEVNGGRHAAQDMNLVHAGINIPEMLVDMALGKPVAPIDDASIRDGVFCLKFVDEIILDYDEAMRAIKGMES